MEELSHTVLVILVVGLLGTGVVAGLLAGLLGVGGGIVIVPVLFWVLEALDFPSVLSMQMAVGTSLATIVPTSLSSMRAHHRKGAVDGALLRLWGPAVVVGAAAGGLAAGPIGGDGLKLVFGVIALAVSVNMATPRRLIVAAAPPVSRWINRIIATLIGFFSALMGIGGGTLSVPTLSACSYPMHRAVGTASAIGLLIALPAVLGFIWSGLGVPGRPPLSLGYVNLAAAAIIFPVTVLCAPVGAGLAHRLNQKRLRQAFALFLALTALRMLHSVFVS